MMASHLLCRGVRVAVLAAFVVPGFSLGQSGTRRVAPAARKPPAVLTETQQATPTKVVTTPTPAAKSAPDGAVNRPAASDTPFLPKAVEAETKTPPSFVGAVIRSIPPSAPVAVTGIDPVVLVETGKAVDGLPNLATCFDSRVFRFSSPDTKKRFDANPADFVPVLGGNSIVAFKERLQNVPGEVFLVHEGRAYFFSNNEELSKFQANPAEFTDADLILQGYSPVNLSDRERLRRGDKSFQIVYEGRRVFFADESERVRFQSDPGRYFPVLFGADPVSFKQGKPTSGVARFSAIYKNRLFNFSNEANRKTFLENADAYSEMDIAIEGRCPVAGGADGKGKPGHFGLSIPYLGKRYLFADERSRLKFLAEPATYVSAK